MPSYDLGFNFRGSFPNYVTANYKNSPWFCPNCYAYTPRPYAYMPRCTYKLDSTYMPKVKAVFVANFERAADNW